MANVMIIVGWILAVIAWSSLDGVEGGATGDWVKINRQTPVCFGAKGSSYGVVQNNAMSGIVGAVKLVHIRGWVRCAHHNKYNSRWGCANMAEFQNFPLNIVGTDENNHVLFPNKDLFQHPQGLWYYLPFTNTVSSSELVFADIGRPFYFPLKQKIRIWYGEDLGNNREADNSGRVCVDVYAKFV